MTQSRGGQAAPGEAGGEETGIEEGAASPGARFNLVKVFTSTKAKDRESLGEKVTAWLADHPAAHVVKALVTQSSDAEFHCLSIILFCAA